MMRSTSRFLKAATSTAALMQLDAKHSAHNYAPLPVMFKKAKGCRVWDVEGKMYLDFLSAYGAVSQGHVHPTIIRAATKQLKQCTLSSRAFCNAEFSQFARFITKFFKYDMVLPMNTGAEGVETALKLARKWGYKVKGIPQNKAIVLCATSNFHGRTFGAIAMSDDPSAYQNYGPKLPGFVRVKYGDVASLKAAIKRHGKRICGFICEPIQGEAGIKIPPHGYLKQVRQLCTKHKIVYIDDEVQSGVGRTGKMLAVEHEGVRPDVVILAKALGGGVVPVAAVLADKQFMGVFEPGTHGSTFGGNPLACKVATASLQVIKKEKLVENSARVGAMLKQGLLDIQKKYPKLIREVRGRGLFCAMVFSKRALSGQAAKRYMYILKDLGVLTKITRGDTIRITPPLTLTPQILNEGLKKLEKAVELLEAEIRGSKLHEPSSKP